MKNLIGVLALILATQANAQDFKKVQTSVVINRYEDAKADYEKIVAKKPSAGTTAEGYYWKAKIYSGLSRDSKNTTALAEVKASLDKYIDADAANKYAIAKENGTEPFFDLYSSNFKLGIAAFSDKKWKDAAATFDEAVKYSDIIFTQSWASSKQKFDTTSLLYAGYANQNAGNKEKAIEYYKRLIDANIKADEFVDIYKYVLIYYSDLKTKDANFDTYYALAEAAYPKENWFDFKVDFFEKNYTLADKMKIYEEKSATNSLTESEYLMYGDAFMAAKNDEATAKDETYVIKAAEAYKKAYALNSKNFTAAFNAGISYYNQFTTLDEKAGENTRALQTLNASKPAAPKDPKKKAEFEAAFKAKADAIKKLNVALEPETKAAVDGAIEWIEKAFAAVRDKEKLERLEKNVASRSVDFLATLYQYKRDKVRGKDQKAFDALDVKFNEYDKLHDKYQ